MLSILNEREMKTSEPKFVVSNRKIMLPGIVLLLFSSIASAQQTAVSDEAGYRVFVGDILEISVWKEPELQKTVLVRPDGKISLPLLGDIDAAGRAVSDIRESIVDEMQKYIPQPVVTVSVTEIRGYKIYVIGQVNNPGMYTVMPTIDIMQALSLAGGTTAFASLNDIIVLRRIGSTRQAIPFRYSDVARGRKLGQNIELVTGDVVVVP